jgi:hypothetical protein
MVNDTLPPSLTRFGAELERAIARELKGSAPQPAASRSPRRRRAITATAVVGCAIAGAGVYAIVSSSSASTHQSRWAQMVLRRVAAVAVPTSPDTILHVAGSETLSPAAQHDSATHVASLTAEQWSQQGPPWRSVMILHDAGGPVLRESGDGRIYDTRNHVLYAPPKLPSGHPKYTIRPGSTAGTYTIRFQTKHGPVSQPISSSDIHALRDGDQQTSWAETWNGHQAKLVPMIVPTSGQAAKLSAQQPSGASSNFATELRGLLKSGHARVVRSTTADGRPAIEISSVHPQSGPQTTYFVDPHSYTPIEVDTYGYHNPADVTRIRFRTYQLLPLKGNERLLRFSVPKSATVDRSPADAFGHMGLPPFW